MGDMFDIFRIMLELMLFGFQGLDQLVLMSDLFPQFGLLFFIRSVLPVLGVKQAEDADGGIARRDEAERHQWHDVW